MAAFTGKVTGFGAAALDVYRPLGEVGNDYAAGEKVAKWTGQDDELLKRLMNDGVERHVGGNAVNVLAYLSLRRAYEEIRFVSVLGNRSDEVSAQIFDHLRELRINTDHVAEVEEYQPSVGIIERANGDRMVRGRPRGPMPDHIGEDRIKTAVAGSGLVIAASLKDVGLTRHVFELTPGDVPISYNPGGSEFRDHPTELRKIMLLRKPYLLALNETEIAQLYGEDVPDDVSKLAALAERATNLARFVLCTAGRRGIILAGGNDSVHAEAMTVENPEDTLGAGDRAHAVTIDGLMQNRAPENIVNEVAHSTAQVVRHRGAHGDLYSSIYG